MTGLWLVLVLVASGALGQPYQPYDGSDQFGATNGILMRREPLAFDDGISIPRGGLSSRLVSPRAVSNAVLDPTRAGGGILSDPTNTALVIFWGQFGVDHDLSFTLSNTSVGSTSCVEPFNISIPRGDPRFDPTGTGTKTMFFCRANYIAGTGTSAANPRQFTNILTPIFDGSQVYGESESRALLLRTLQGGLLKTSLGADGEFPPLNTFGGSSVMMNMGNDANVSPLSSLYAAGDLRANEQPILFALHALMIREHNRRARLISARDPSKTDEQVFQEARRMVIGHIQAITKNEWFPAFVGGSMGPYQGYQQGLNPQVDVFFSTAAMRTGHDGIPSVVLRVDAEGNEIPRGHLLLRDAFFKPNLTVETGITATLRGAALNPAQLMDAIFVPDIRDFLFSLQANLAFDLGSRNLQRGRDLGLPGYNTIRAAYGLPTCTTFQCVAENQTVASRLEALYNGNIDDLDPFIAGVSERKRPGEKVGELFATAITEQLNRVRHADKWWYENLYSSSDPIFQELERTTLGDIIRRNTDAKEIRSNVFKQNTNPVIRPKRHPANTINFVFDGMLGAPNTNRR